MKRLFLIILALFINVSFFSCTSLDDDLEYQNQVETQDCCGDGETDPPPPPPPPGGGSGG